MSIEPELEQDPEETQRLYKLRAVTIGYAHLTVSTKVWLDGTGGAAKRS